MSFAKRLEKFPPMNVTWVKPQERPHLSLCLPRVMLFENAAQGLVGIEVAPIIAGGIGALRLLSAFVELVEEMDAAPPEFEERYVKELGEAAKAFRKHLNMTAATSDKAHAEHDASHRDEHGGRVH